MMTIKHMIRFWKKLSKGKKGIEGFEWWLEKKEESAFEKIALKNK